MFSQPDQQHSLNAEQANVLRLLLRGLSVSAAAAQTGVPTGLIFYWTRHNELFQSALEASCERRVHDANEQIHALYPQALEILKKALLTGDVKPIQLRAALAILKMVRQDQPERSVSRGTHQQLDHELEQHAHLLTRPTAEPVSEPAPELPVTAKPHPRNLPCPCGSGLKHKRCCGAPAPRTIAQAA